MKRVHLFISGRVQGVTFRHNTRKRARKWDLTGFVRNLDDGRVEVVAEGDDSAVDDLVDFCRKGPLLAKVRDIEISEEEPKKEFDSFNIKY